MQRTIAAIVLGAALVAATALAEPQVEVRYFDGVPQIHLAGNYANLRYTVWRAGSAEGPFTTSVTDQSTLCVGPCFAEDRIAEPGRTYWYRFDLERPDGTRDLRGPFAVTISPLLARRVGIRMFPNPGAALTRVELNVMGARADRAVAAEVALFDLGGRRVRLLHRGELPRGLTALAWDGRDDRGQGLKPGSYFARISTPLGAAVTRVLRVR